MKIIRFLFILSAYALAATPSFKVDFDQSGRNSSEVTEANYAPWVVTGVTSKDTVLEGVKVTVASNNGTGLKTNWYKAGIQSPYYAKLACDGIFVENGNSGGEITLTFSGLKEGTHSLLAYLNNVDAPTAYTYSDIAVYVNGTKITTVTPKNRPLSLDTATTAYVTFSVTSSGSAVIKFTPVTNSATFKNVTLNGFALNVENSAAQAKNPIPEDLDDHADSDNGVVQLSWTAASSAKKHRIYYGIDSLDIVNATEKSNAYKGEQTALSYSIKDAYALYDYFWRIDEVDASGVITKGNVWRFRIGREAFEGAEGYGKNARGGRMGKVVYVTNLNDDGEGSLREACTADIGPRTILFKVAGVIELKSRLVCNQSYVTIAGQSAPGKGITLKSAPIGFTGNDMIIRFMRMRLGYGTTYDGMGLTGGNYSILDHASISWTIDEAFSSRGGKNLTLQRTLISEALNIANHQNYPSGTAHGYAATIGGDIGSYHHNLLAHNDGRNFSLGGGLDGNGYYAGRLDIFNNVVYNWVDRATDGGAHEVNFVGNFYKEGPATTLHMMLRAQLEGTGLGSQAYYYSNNILQSKSGSYTCDGNNDACGREYILSNGQTLTWDVWNSTPFFPSKATIQTASAAYKDVLSDVGHSMPVLDDHDTRIIKEVKNQSYTYTGSVGGLKGIIDRESDAGGYENYPSVSYADDYDSDLDGLPDWWELLFGTNVNSSKGDFNDANKDRLGDGYTELERFLEYMARPHYKLEIGETQTIDLSEFTKGYSGGTYSVLEVPTGVNASISGSNLNVSTTSSFKGLGYIKFQLKDKDGDTFMRYIGIRGDVSETALTDSTIIKKCGAGSQWQGVIAGDSITPFCYTWKNANTVEIEGMPSGINVYIDNNEKIVWIKGIATDVPGAYTYKATAIGGNNAYEKGGVITIVKDSSELKESEESKNASKPIQNLMSYAKVSAKFRSGFIFLENLPANANIFITDLSGSHILERKNLKNREGYSTSLDLRAYSKTFLLVHISSINMRQTFKVAPLF